MAEIPDSLQSLFSASIERVDGSYVIELPPEEIARDAIDPGTTYRIAVLEQPTSRGSTPDEEQLAYQQSRSSQSLRAPGNRTPPVEAGEIREVTVEATGREGDGIAKVERGYVLIVSDATPGDEVVVEIRTVRANVAFAEIVREQ